MNGLGERSDRGDMPPMGLSLFGLNELLRLLAARALQQGERTKSSPNSKLELSIPGIAELLGIPLKTGVKGFLLAG